MKVSLSWLKELVDYNLSPKQLAEKLSLTSIGVKQTTNEFLELDLTYNRGDLLSMRGVAREVAAITESSIKFQDLPKLDSNLPKTIVKIEDEKLSPVQCSAKIEGLKVGPSSPDWVKKLADCGIRSVNNVVDVTNLIMLKFGQPLHAFDAETLKDETIIVRNARAGEQLVTLDGKLRKLSTQDIVLADTDKPLDVAGIMGSKDTEIKQSTHTILLSASMFNPVMVRKTAQKIGLQSEASKRFLHGLTKTNLLQAYAAAIKLYESLGGKLTATNLVGDFNEKSKTVNLTLKKVNSLIGLKLSASDVEQALEKLGFVLKRIGVKLRHLEGGLGWHVRVPYWRLDIEIEEDLIEEVARMYGYEKIPSQELRGKLPEKMDQSFYNSLYTLRVTLKNAGLTEVQSYSFYSTKVLQALDFYKLSTSDVLSKIVKIANPISSETEYLRTFIWPNLVEVVGRNIKQGYKDIAIFEIGKVYRPGPKESYRLAIALMNGTNNPIEELLALQGETLRACKVKPGGMMKELEALFHPKRYANIEVNGKIIGGLSEVHPRFLNKFGIEKRVAILEIDLNFPQSQKS